MGFVRCTVLLGVLDPPEGKMGGKKCMRTKIRTLEYSFEVIFHKGTKGSVVVKSCHDLKQVKKKIGGE